MRDPALHRPGLTPDDEADSTGVMILALSSEGWSAKSKPDNVLSVESRAISSAVLILRLSRKLSSSMTICSMG
jgi:hypothetical protein